MRDIAGRLRGRRAWATGAGVVVLLGTLLVRPPTSHRHADDERYYRKLVAGRALPNRATLANRCTTPDPRERNRDCFYDLLTLRDRGDRSAVPVLGQILTAHRGSLHIHGYAAAQALFSIGGPEANALLAGHLLSSGYSAYWGIRYAHHWEMVPARRDDFIRRYHLVTLADDLRATLAARGEADGRRLTLTVTLTNTSDAALQFPDWQRDVGSLLFVRSARDGYLRAHPAPIWEEERIPHWVTLAPGASHELQSVVEIQGARHARHHCPSLPQDARLILDTGSAFYAISGDDDLFVCALVEVTAADAAASRKMGCARPWVGRAVSNAISVRAAARPGRRLLEALAEQVAE
jgi:hypothetical protein